MTVDNHLYLSARKSEEEEEIEISIETYICLFVYIYCELDIKIYFIDDVETHPCTLPSSILNDINYSFFCGSDEQNSDFNLVSPAVSSENGTVFISGLCSVLRWVIKDKLAQCPHHFSHFLLGFRGGCLVACTESSIWTKFCELQLPSSVNEVSQLKKHESDEAQLMIPDNLILLEAHLRRPVRTHNILKRKLDIAKEIKNSASKPTSSVTCDSSVASNIEKNFTLCDDNQHPVQNEEVVENLKNLVITEQTKEFSLNHCYLEGIDLTLADMIVFPCVHYFMENLPFSHLEHFEHVLNWYKRMVSNKQIKEAAQKCAMFPKSFPESTKSEPSVTVPIINQDSLYKRDPSHSKMRIKYKNPTETLQLLKEFNIYPEYSETCCTQLDWDNLPQELHPATGDLPAKRVERKCQQIESMVTAALKIAVEGQTIVEFCAGGGHVGLLLAYFLPKCKIILIENKESSMQRAIVRAKALKLQNIIFYQCNLDYFKASFDMGISLHACGVATDLVIQQCLQQQASFVCCPCCYGGVQDTHLLHYPLSNKFRTTGLSYKNYTLLAHCADRNELNTPTAEQGELCMGLIDTDRSHLAQEYDYEVKLSTLHPKSCSPKHNLLIGVSPKWKNI